MLDFEKAIVSSLLECVDQVGANLVANTYQNLVHQYSPFIWTMTAIYVGMMFLQAQQGRKTFYDFMNATFRTVFILSLALNYHYFCTFIYDVVTKEPLVILKAIVLKGGEATPVSISQALDNFINVGLVYTNKLFLMGSWNNFIYFVFALLVLVMTGLSALFAAGLIILSKCAAIVLLALSPLFIFFALFEMTQGLFEAYIRHLITYALIPVLTSAILMILFSVSEYVIQFMNQFPQASFKAVVPYFLMCGIEIYLLAQVFAKASALGSGFSLGSMVSVLKKTQGNMASTASAMVGGYAGKQALKTAGMIAGTSAYKAVSNTASRMNRFRK